MTNLERTLASILTAIAEADAVPSLRAALVRRRDAICAALAAPEHASAVLACAPAKVRPPSRTRTRQPALAEPCI